jgi:tRNA threonylcarbamoyladenosine biosynthesis protein TsaB
MSPMKSLIIETSSEWAVLAVVDNQKIVYEVRLDGGPSLSKCLGPEIKKILGPFDRIVVGTGPGSFTGVRVGLAMAEALSLGWKIPLYTCSSLTAYAPCEGTFTIVVDARSGGIYVQENFDTPRLLPREEAQGLHAFSPHPERIGSNAIPAKPNPILLDQKATLR